MPEIYSPRQVVEAVMQGISQGAWADLHVWYAEDAVVEYPFGLSAPNRLEGVEAIRKHFARTARLPLTLVTRNMVVHETADPEVVVAEWDYDGMNTAAGRPFQVANIQVSRVRNGKIVASRDYHDHFTMAEAMGGLSSLLEAVAARET